jgi:hypothetical protein
MWADIKATDFYHNLHLKTDGVPLPLRDWLRVLLLVSSSLSMNELTRVFDEEDTVIAMSSVCCHGRFCRMSSWHWQALL